MDAVSVAKGDRFGFETDGAFNIYCDEDPSGFGFLFNDRDTKMIIGKVSVGDKLFFKEYYYKLTLYFGVQMYLENIEVQTIGDGVEPKVVFNASVETSPVDKGHPDPSEVPMVAPTATAETGAVDYGDCKNTTAAAPPIIMMNVCSAIFHCICIYCHIT